MPFLLERDTLNGASGTAFVTIDGQVQQLFQAKNIKASQNIQSTDMKVIGTKIIQDKSTGTKQTGTMTIYYGSPLFTRMAVEYANTGVMQYFDMQVTNNDPTTTVGQQVVALYGCKISGEIDITKMDADSDMLDQTVNFSYTKAEILQSFHEPASYGG